MFSLVSKDTSFVSFQSSEGRQQAHTPIRAEVVPFLARAPFYQVQSSRGSEINCLGLATDSSVTKVNGEAIKALVLVDIAIAAHLFYTGDET